MDAPPRSLPLTEFKDRRTGLMVFGILEMLLGCLFALLVPLMVLGQAMAAQATEGASSLRPVIPAMLMYAALAVAFIWLGIGSVRCRRWARALMLVLAWNWLVTGVLAIGFLLFLSPKMMEGVPASARGFALAFAALIWTVLFLVIPGILVVFNQSRHVKATCEARDPVPRWTDRCPLPVLSVSVWLVAGGAMMLAMPLLYHAVVPCFGTLLSGLPGTLFCLLAAALWIYLARAWYRLQPMAWWITLGAFLLLAISSALTFARVDLIDMYRLMGYPPEQIALIERYNSMSGGMMLWSCACWRRNRGLPPSFAGTT